MARIRTIKPGFFRSEEVAALSYRARLTWVGLWTYVDDEGRGIDSARLIKGDLWALDDDVTWQDVEADLVELESHGRILRYSVEGKRYLLILKWDEHQVISRSTPSKLPPPLAASETPAGDDAAPFAEDSVSPHVLDTAGRGTGNREEEQGTGNREARGARDNTRALPDRFDEFWDSYPRRVDKPAARRAWAKATRTHSPELILEGARRYANDPNRLDQFTKHPGPWLNAEGWNDPALPTRSNNGRESSLDRIDRQREEAFAELARLEQQQTGRPRAIGA